MIAKLFEMQRELDEHIIKEKGLEGQDLLPNTILALQVELGELANEWRGFKHWSNDQKPRRNPKLCPRCVGTGEVRYYTNETCTRCGGTGVESQDPLLEEYVDCLHFILSIGLQIGTDEDIRIDSDYTTDDPIKDFNDMFFGVSRLFNRYNQGQILSKFDYEVLFNFFVGIGERHLGVTWDEIEAAYLAKNAVNHQRQVTGY